MQNLMLFLVVSIFLNVFSLRWALQEYAHRRELEKQTVVLERALHSISDGPPGKTKRGLGLWIWLLGALFLAGSLLFLVAG